MQLFAVNTVFDSGKYRVFKNALSAIQMDTPELQSFLYQTKLSSIPGCPAENDCIPGPLYRWVFEDKTHENNFRPTNEINPRRDIVEGPAKHRCDGYALSFFTSREFASKKYRELCDRYENLPVEKGTFLAEITYIDPIGVSSKPNRSGHVNLHPFQTTNFTEIAKWVGPIIKS